MAAALPTFSEFIGHLQTEEKTEEIPIILGNTSVIRAALILGAKISLVVTGAKNPQLSDAATIGANVQTFLKLKEWCEKKGITMPATEITEIIGGFQVNVQISLGTTVIPFQEDLPFVHTDSQKTASFVLLVCALASKPIDETSMLIEAFKLQQHGLAPLVSASALVAPPKEELPFNPFGRQVAVSPFEARSVAPSPIQFLEAAKANIPPEYTAPHVSVQEIPEEQEEEQAPFTEVMPKRRHFFGASGSPPKSMPTGAVYNPVKGKIAAWHTFKEGGIARDRKLTEIFADWIKFVLQNHDRFKDGSREGFRSYLEHQLGDDYASLKHLISV